MGILCLLHEEALSQGVADDFHQSSTLGKHLTACLIYEGRVLEVSLVVAHYVVAMRIGLVKVLIRCLVLALLLRAYDVVGVEHRLVLLACCHPKRLFTCLVCLLSGHLEDRLRVSVSFEVALLGGLLDLLKGGVCSLTE